MAHYTFDKYQLSGRHHRIWNSHNLDKKRQNQWEPYRIKLSRTFSESSIIYAAFMEKRSPAPSTNLSMCRDLIL